MYFEVESKYKLKFLPTPDFSEVKDDEVLIKRVGVGLCRSDVGVFDGRESIPSGMFGHEGYGVVEKAGKKSFFREGDYVASFWHPAYADHYVAPANKCVEIRGLEPKWAIVQPLASILNAFDFANEDTLLIGRGFTAQLLKQAYAVMDEQDKHGVVLFDESEKYSRKWSSVIETAGRGMVDPEIFNDEAELVWFSTLQEPITTNLFEWSWKALNVRFPSPRQRVMINNMAWAANLLEAFEPTITHLFKFENAQSAFETASSRSDGYLKGIFFDESLV